MPAASTLNDVARAAGVTRMTVSRAFSGNGAVAESTRARIFEAAGRLGYRPHLAARATRTGRTGFVGLLQSAHSACSVHDPVFQIGLSEAMHRHGTSLVQDLVDSAPAKPTRPEAGPDTPNPPDTPGSSDAEKLAPRIVHSRAADGLLLNYVFDAPPAIAGFIDRCRIPVVWINRRCETNCVHPADRGAAMEGTRHLLRHGHRRVTMLDLERPAAHATFGDPHYSDAARWGGHRQAMREAGFAPRLELLPRNEPDEYLPGRYASSCLAWLRRRAELPAAERPTAVLCRNDLGRVMVAAAWRLGLTVPGDLSVMSFDNAAGADNVIACDRLLVRYRALAHAAVDEIHTLIEAPGEPRPPVVVPFEFHRAGTVAAPLA